MNGTAEREELSKLFGHEEDAHAPVERLVERLLAARRQKEEAEAALKAANASVAEAEAKVFIALDAAGQKSLRHGGVTLSACESRHYRIPPEALQRPDLVRWILQNGGHDLLSRFVEARAFSHFCRQLASENRRLHPLVEEYARKTVQIRKKDEESP